ncbi:nuclear distribution protein nudE homolog isoform X1 [Teleopsis dalmanni]|uniref:nuclear distribution protein nudE homolog isoform X1 n=1 Tax=Teleopsis dalmanni TaxID=139649 RepID=UPI0018CE9BD0|nr:nuclear distribution protein nudE homolog isoform X1 [Teleopsis dalmanni]XP_037933839.1 nuclear distribution protein nudE homolog isoform X1 [Teleopsis dalmanni]
MESPPMFNSVEDECRYWKERAKLYHKEWTDVKQEYDEYVEQSRQMEAEMDATIDQKLAVIKDLKMKVNVLEKENESLKLKIDSHNLDFANVEKQLESVKKERDSMKEYLRQLEQKNDDLERAHRILNESIVDFEKMLDKAYEKNALLELEVDEKEMLQEKLQRLMDETRDLKQELNIKGRYSQSNGAVNNAINTSTGSIPNGIAVSLSDLKSYESSTTINSGSMNINELNEQQSLKRKSYQDPDNLLNGNAMTASSRTTALNIVADMLRKLNLDKALLCPHCEKFRCICDRPTATLDQSYSSQSNSVSNNQNRLSRSFTKQFGSNHSVNTHTNTSITQLTDDESLGDSSASASAASLLRTSNHNSTNLNFGTNIFKRFAERMSGNSNLFATSTTSNSTNTKYKDDSKNDT